MQRWQSFAAWSQAFHWLTAGLDLWTTREEIEVISEHWFKSRLHQDHGMGWMALLFFLSSTNPLLNSRTIKRYLRHSSSQHGSSLSLTYSLCCLFWLAVSNGMRMTPDAEQSCRKQARVWADEVPFAANTHSSSTINTLTFSFCSALFTRCHWPCIARRSFVRFRSWSPDRF